MGHRAHETQWTAFTQNGLARGPRVAQAPAGCPHQDPNCPAAPLTPAAKAVSPAMLEHHDAMAAPVAGSPFAMNACDQSCQGTFPAPDKLAAGGRHASLMAGVARHRGNRSVGCQPGGWQAPHFGRPVAGHVCTGHRVCHAPTGLPFTHGRHHPTRGADPPARGLWLKPGRVQVRPGPGGVPRWW